MYDNPKWPQGTIGWLTLLFVYIPALALFSDIVFYVTHRGCHEVSFLYKYFHKLHHEWVDTFGVVATSAHPVEQFLG